LRRIKLKLKNLKLKNLNLRNYKSFFSEHL
jgi:hypothetical protein